MSDERFEVHLAPLPEAGGDIVAAEYDVPVVPVTEPLPSVVASRNTTETIDEATAPDSVTALDSPELDSLPRRMASAYFKPKRFESQSLYERAGVKIYKKYVPTSGDLVAKHFGQLSALAKTGTRRERVEKFEKETRMVEVIHLGGFAVMQAALTKMGMFEDVHNMIIASGAQLATNVYPIMVQRYNRIRSLRILSRHQTH